MGYQGGGFGNQQFARLGRKIAALLSALVSYQSVDFVVFPISSHLLLDSTYCCYAFWQSLGLIRHALLAVLKPVSMSCRPLLLHATIFCGLFQHLDLCLSFDISKGDVSSNDGSTKRLCPMKCQPTKHCVSVSLKVMLKMHCSCIEMSKRGYWGRMS